MVSIARRRLLKNILLCLCALLIVLVYMRIKRRKLKGYVLERFMAMIGGVRHE